LLHSAPKLCANFVLGKLWLMLQDNAVSMLYLRLTASDYEATMKLAIERYASSILIQSAY
jgi:hypothetical protein